MPKTKSMTVCQVRHNGKYSQHDLDCIAEISELANSKERFRFVRHLEEYFTLVEIVLIMRALNETHPATA